MSDLNEFNRNGFIIKKQLFTHDEIKKLINFINSNSDKENQSRKTRSSTGTHCSYETRYNETVREVYSHSTITFMVDGKGYSLDFIK